MFAFRRIFQLQIPPIQRFLTKNDCHKFPKAQILCENIRYISTGKILHKKYFIEKENQFAYDIMQKRSDKYHLSSMQSCNDDILDEGGLESVIGDDWSNRKPAELLRTFNALSNLAHRDSLDISSESYDKFIDALTDAMEFMSDDDLHQICADLKKWPQTESTHTRNFIEVWAALDDNFNKRLINWNVDKLLMFNDCLYNLFLSTKTEFFKAALIKASRYSRYLKPEELVQIMFYLATRRKPLKDMLKLERRFGECVDHLSVEELGIIGMGFFKCRISIKDKYIIRNVINKMALVIDQLNDITICGLLKVIRLSSSRVLMPEVTLLLNAITPHIHKLSLLTCVQLAIVGTPTYVYHHPSLIKIADKFLENPSEARIKDLERLAYAYSNYNFPADFPVYGAILNELKRPERKEEISKYGRSLYICLAHLQTAKIYPYDLINSYLDRSKLKQIYPTLPAFIPLDTDRTYSRELLTIDRSIEVECDDYTGNRIDDKIIRKLSKTFIEFLPDEDDKISLNTMEKVTLDILQFTRESRGGKQFAILQNILPHFDRCDIVFADDCNGKPVAVDTAFSLKEYYDVKHIPDQDLTWYSIIIIRRNGFTSSSPPMLLGSINMRLRQLKKLGYIPRIITWAHWTTLGSDEKADYVTQLFTEPESKQVLI